MSPRAALPDSIDVLIVGAGHAGLSMSGLLRQAGREHLVVDRRARPGGGWQDRWDNSAHDYRNEAALPPGARIHPDDIDAGVAPG